MSLWNLLLWVNCVFRHHHQPLIHCITFQRNILRLYQTLPQAKICKKGDFSQPWALTVLFINLYCIKLGCDGHSIFQTWIGNTHDHMQWVIEFWFQKQFPRYETIVRTYWMTHVRVLYEDYGYVCRKTGEGGRRSICNDNIGIKSAIKAEVQQSIKIFTTMRYA